MRTTKSIQRSSSRPAATAVRILAVIGGSILLSNLYGCATFDKCGSAGCAGDAKTTANVEAQFRQHAELSPPNLLTVQTLDHVVYLSGLVSSGLQRDDAEEAAREASDGARIVDTISVIQ
jgi:osmotically-inducible protein OsmY